MKRARHSQVWRKIWFAFMICWLGILGFASADMYDGSVRAQAREGSARALGDAAAYLDKGQAAKSPLGALSYLMSHKKVEAGLEGKTVVAATTMEAASPLVEVSKLNAQVEAAIPSETIEMNVMHNGSTIDHKVNELKEQSQAGPTDGGLNELKVKTELGVTDGRVNGLKEQSEAKATDNRVNDLKEQSEAGMPKKDLEVEADSDQYERERAAEQLQLEQAIYDELAKGEYRASTKSYRTPQQKTVYLTFDDGPTGLTPEVLDILKKEDIKATFFILGKLAEKQTDTVRRIVDEGHALGNHSYDHDYKALYPDFVKFWEQLKKTEIVLEQSVGVRPDLVRAPGGTFNKFDAFYFYYLERAGYIVHDWNVDSGDSRRRNVPKSEIVANVTKAPLQDEMIVLLHDGANHEETVRALPEIIAHFRTHGYEFAPLTSEVKPVTFRVADAVKGRAPGFAKHVAMLEEVDAVSLAMLAVQEQDGSALPGRVGSNELIGVSLGEMVHSSRAVVDQPLSCSETPRAGSCAQWANLDHMRGDGFASLQSSGKTPVLDTLGMRSDRWIPVNEAHSMDRSISVGEAYRLYQYSLERGMDWSSPDRVQGMDRLSPTDGEDEMERFIHAMQIAAEESAAALEALETIGDSNERIEWRRQERSPGERSSSQPMIPLRTFMEARGALVEWWGSQGKAVIYDRQYILEYSVEEQVVRIYSLGSIRYAAVVPDMYIKDGTLMVPQSHADLALSF